MDVFPRKNRLNRFSVNRFKPPESNLSNRFLLFSMSEASYVSGFRFVENVIRCPSLLLTPHPIFLETTAESEVRYKAP